MDGRGGFNVRQILQDFNPSKLVVCIALFLQSIILSSRLDNVITSSYWVVFLPLWLWKALVIFAAVTGYARFLRRPDARRDTDTRRDIYALSFSLAIHVLLLIFEVLVAVQVEGHARMSWRLVFIPLFLLCVLSLVACIFSLALQRNIEFEVVILVNILLIIFVAVRLDGLTSWHWETVFVPLWILFVIGFGVAVFYMILSVNVLRGRVQVPSERYCSTVAHGFFFLLILLPLLVFAIMLVLQLDGKSSISYRAIFAPLHISFLVMCITCVYQRGGNPWWFGFQMNFCTFLLTHCSLLQEYGNIVYKRPTEDDIIPDVEASQDRSSAQHNSSNNPAKSAVEPIALDVPD